MCKNACIGECNQINKKRMKQTLSYTSYSMKRPLGHQPNRDPLINHMNVQINVACPNEVLPKRKC